MKFCYVCKEEKLKEDFHKSKNRSDGLNSRCKPCQVAYNKLRYDKDPESFKLKRIQKRYGLSKEQYYELTKNGCEVCGSFNLLHVDHDHSCCPSNIISENTCGKCIRGILCKNCNTAEGLLMSNPDIARALALYMERLI